MKSRSGGFCIKNVDMLYVVSCIKNVDMFGFTE